jgi:hypothetical protein
MNWRAFACVLLGSLTSSLAVSAAVEHEYWAVSGLATWAWFCLWGLLASTRS